MVSLSTTYNIKRWHHMANVRLLRHLTVNTFKRWYFKLAQFALFVIGTTLYICMSALPFWVEFFVTYNKENYHVYSLM